MQVHSVLADDTTSTSKLVPSLEYRDAGKRSGTLVCLGAGSDILRFIP